MLESFIKLYKKIYENKENIIIEPLGIKLNEDLSVEVITTLLLQLVPTQGRRPLIESVEKKEELKEFDNEFKIFNKERVLKAYYLIKKARVNRIVRAVLYGKDKDELFDQIKEDFVYEDEEIKTVYFKDEIYFSLYTKMHSELDELINNYDVNLFVYDDYSFINQTESPMEYQLNEDRRRQGRRFNNNLDSVGLYLTIANSKDYLAHEIIAAEVFSELNSEELVLKLIDNINSRFISSYILNPIMIRRRYASIRDYKVINQILEKVKLEDVLDVDIQRAYQMFKK